MAGLEAYLAVTLLVLIMICVYLAYKLFRATHLRAWWLVVLGFVLLIAWRLLILANLISAWTLISDAFLLSILGPLTLGLWQLKRRFSRIYRHVDQAS